MHFTFDHPAALLLLLLLPCFYFCRRKGESRILPKLEWLPKRSRLFNRELLFRVVIYTLGVLALAGPFLYASKLPSERKGVAIVLALDTSGSMRESGFGEGDESKFEVMQQLASAFIKRRIGDNIGVVAFGTFAFTASPVSYDLEGVISILKMLEVEIAGKNTAIGEGIAQSLRTLEGSDAKEKVIVLVTDGKNNSGSISVKRAVEEAKRKGVKIYTIGVGSPKEYDADMLQRIAGESGGKAFGALHAKDLEKVYDEIDRLLPSPLRSDHYLQQRQLYFYPLGIAIALLFWYLYRRSLPR